MQLLFLLGAPSARVNLADLCVLRTHTSGRAINCISGSSGFYLVTLVLAEASPVPLSTNCRLPRRPDLRGGPGTVQSRLAVGMLSPISKRWLVASAGAE
ncbi:hypothetical protein IWZ00DRAFT_152800 [Phyllosticta capitalensis]